ncbi:MAG: transposase [Myxococcales bacterium]|nr:transposase [Myxococcales bacterium]
MFFPERNNRNDKRRTKHSPTFKAKVALEAIREQGTTAEISGRHEVPANVIYKWKRELLDNLSQLFEAPNKTGGSSDREDELLRKIGELTVERDFLSSGVGRCQ